MTVHWTAMTDEDSGPGVGSFFETRDDRWLWADYDHWARPW